MKYNTSFMAVHSRHGHAKTGTFYTLQCIYAHSQIKGRFVFKYSQKGFMWSPSWLMKSTCVSTPLHPQYLCKLSPWSLNVFMLICRKLSGKILPTSCHGSLRLLCGLRMRRLRDRARRSTALRLVLNSLPTAKPSMFPLYHITQPPMEKRISSAPEYTSRSPKSLPLISRGANTPISRAATPRRSISTAKTSTNLQWVSPVPSCNMTVTKRSCHSSVQKLNRMRDSWQNGKLFSPCIPLRPLT